MMYGILAALTRPRVLAYLCAVCVLCVMVFCGIVLGTGYAGFIAGKALGIW